MASDEWRVAGISRLRAGVRPYSPLATRHSPLARRPSISAIPLTFRPSVKRRPLLTELEARAKVRLAFRPDGMPPMLVFLLVFASSLGMCLLLTPLARAVARQCRLVDRPDGRRKLHAGAIPLAGGLPILL